MTWLEVLDWAIRLYEWARKMAEAQGLSSEEFEAQAEARAKAAQARADDQRKAELEAMR